MWFLGEKRIVCVLLVVTLLFEIGGNLLVIWSAEYIIHVKDVYTV